jgi:integrase
MPGGGCEEPSVPASSISSAFARWRTVVCPAPICPYIQLLRSGRRRRPAHPRALRHGRGGGADRGRPDQPARTPRRDDDPPGLPARATGIRGLRPSLRPGRLQRCRAARPAGQERHPEHAPYQGDELRALRRLQRESQSSPFVFVSERGPPFTAAGLARMIERAAAAAGLELKAHPHMLRHACGYALANKGHEHPGDSGLARPSVDHQHCRLQGAGAEPVQGLLAGLICPRTDPGNP